jgi:CubicO group peptidase (beta-lactamase class C family)
MKARDFGALHTAMQRWVTSDHLAGLSVAVLQGDGAVHMHCTGWANREERIALREDHLFRAYSSTKLVTSCAALLLLEEGRFALDDPIERFLPELAARRVLTAGAQRIDDTVPASRPITIRQLFSHSGGLSYGLFDPGSLLFTAYAAQRVGHPSLTLAQMVQALGSLPLAFEPGTRFEYSVATDVLARLVEVICDQPFDRVLRERIFEPLQMADTGFVVPEPEQPRLTALYRGESFQDPTLPGLHRAEHLLHPGAHLKPVPRLSGGGGLVTSLPDSVKLLRSLMPGKRTLLKPETLALMASNQLPAGRWIEFPGRPAMVGRGHGLAGGVLMVPDALSHPDAAGELYWGGLAGTQWWISSRHDFAAAIMAQRWFGHDHPFVVDIKREVYNAVLGTAHSA